MNILDHIRTVPDFPKEGINFYDISTLLAHPQAWKKTIADLAEKIQPYEPDMLLGVEARGFLVASALSCAMERPMGMVRKKGKLPGKTLLHSYALEYGSDEIEIQPDLVTAGQKIVLVDDLLATGGTLEAACHLVQKAGATVSAGACIIELDGLGGRKKFKPPLETLLICPA